MQIFFIPGAMMLVPPFPLLPLSPTLPSRINRPDKTVTNTITVLLRHLHLIPRFTACATGG